MELLQHPLTTPTPLTFPELPLEKTTTRCSNLFCDCNLTELPSKDPIKLTKVKQGKNQLSYCQECLQAFKSNMFCPYCLQIYIDTSTKFSHDYREWIQCDFCSRWVHLDCEESHGCLQIRKFLNSDKYKYNCPSKKCKNAKSLLNKRKNSFDSQEIAPVSIRSQPKIQPKKKRTDPFAAIENLLNSYGSTLYLSDEVIFKDLQLLKKTKTEDDNSIFAIENKETQDNSKEIIESSENSENSRNYSISASEVNYRLRKRNQRPKYEQFDYLPLESTNVNSENK